MFPFSPLPKHGQSKTPWGCIRVVFLQGKNRTFVQQFCRNGEGAGPHAPRRLGTAALPGDTASYLTETIVGQCRMCPGNRETRRCAFRRCGILPRRERQRGAVYEKVWPQGPEVRHPVAPQLLARLEAAPPEVSRQMATVFRKPLVWRAGKSASFSGLSSFDCFVATLPPRLRAKFQRPFSDQDEYAASTSFSFSASAQPPAEASIPDEEDAFASVGVPFQ